ncbi:4-hydroxy-tetrahydrodipicolinate synthase [Arthrobacter sp. zg-Y1143]|uniref:4-hydroxy-tetrahydrodipicolinate synthase n=1 Tax=Arthrobacter sp. zg-Y1143 TaxID=3049065 RepID=UPI0024C4404B|nr:4-hydroxy-tetrahydrodipicolinate synthase [Arthrobacter sp. zg-Y1143]MDK1328663.1 4-hydroxy-tetrahydrodipicolinate synthase [Arthrobacter sp. zg-Y1143]
MNTYTGSTGETAADMVCRRFGRILTAMVTPLDEHGQLDQNGAEELTRWLLRDGWNDAVVVNGTTGESFATSDWEKASMVHSAKRVTQGTGRRVIAGVGSTDTRHSIALARAAAEQQADGLLVVAPYYSRPSQKGLLRHFEAIADSTDRPVMLYDIPVRTGVAIAPETLVAAGKHPNIVAVKDAKGDLASSSWVMQHSSLVYYSGDDVLNLPLLSIGAVGMVSVVGHVAADRLRALAAAFAGGRVDEALRIHRELLPIYTGMFRCPGAASAKAALRKLGLPAGPVRGPLADLDADETALLLADLSAAGLPTTLARGTAVPDALAPTH